MSSDSSPRNPAPVPVAGGEPAADARPDIGYEEKSGRARFFGLLDQETAYLMDPRTGGIRAELAEPAACAVCGTPPPDDVAFEKKGLRFVRCPQCELVYMNPRPSAEALEHLYAFESAANDAWVDVLLTEAEEVFQTEDFSSLIERVGTFRAGGELLDIGCSIGRLMSVARDRGFRVTGLELGARAAEHARTTFGVDVREETLEDSAFPDERFDVVTLIETLEHVPEPSEMLREIHRILRPGGVLVVGVPNVGSLGVLVLGPLARTFNRNHLHYFSERTLARLLRQTGFEVAWTGSKVSLLDSVLNHLNGRDPFGPLATDPLPARLRERLAEPGFRERADAWICELGLGYRLRMIAVRR